MAHLRDFVGSSWRSCSPSCLSCSPSWRRHGQQFEAKCHLRANIIEDSPQDASATPSEHPKSAKKTKLSDIIEAIDENLQITKCSGNDFGCSQKKHSSKCLTHNLWVELGDHLYSFFNSITLDDVINNNLRRTNNVIKLNKTILKETGKEKKFN